VEDALRLFAAIQLLLVGLSHLLRPGAWVDFFRELHRHGHPGVFVHGFLSLGFGSMILAFHNVWSGPRALLTVMGCAYLLKATLCFLAPETQMRTLGRVSHERRWEIQLAGLAFLAVAGVLSYGLATASAASSR
jgi:hypothetical protein